MKCDIKYVGKLRSGTPQYYCSTHKSFASVKGEKLDNCLCNCKDLFDTSFDLEKKKVDSIKIVYENILENKVPKVFINQKVYYGVLKHEKSILHYKDLGGMMLSRLNQIPLEVVTCSHCHQKHSDNGKFAYIPHRTHLCLYCGHLFRVKEKNIGNELDTIYDIPSIQLEENRIDIDKECRIEYELFSGELLINNQKANRVLVDNKEVLIIHFFNELLENEF